LLIPVLKLNLHVSEAANRLEAALNLQRRNWDVLEARGRVLQEMDMHSEAIEALEAALKYIDTDEPDSSRARLHYAIAQVGFPRRTALQCNNWLI
jgi:tetratricopeptide (TPR) repeat protein